MQTFAQISKSKLMLLATISEPEQAEIAEKLDIENTTVKQLKAEIEKLKVEKSNLNDEKETLQNSNNYLKTDFKEVCQNKAEVDRLLTKEQNRNSELEAKIKELESRPIEVAVAEPSDNERRLNETIRALERENIKRNDELEAEYRENEKIVRKQLEDEKQEALRRQKEEYEERLKNVQTADGTSDDKDVFKAYFSIAYDSFNRMLEFAKQSQDKEFFKGKVEHLIEALATQNINL